MSLLALPWVLAVVHIGYLDLSSMYARASPTPISTRADSHRQPGRELIDPCIGSRWQLLVDSEHPSWPGRLVLKSASEAHISNAPGQYLSGQVETRKHASNGIGQYAPAAITPPVIHAGDHVIVDQQSQVIQAQFDAVAMEQAVVGQRLKVRLISPGNLQGSNQGPVISVLATDFGKVRWLNADGLGH